MKTILTISLILFITACDSGTDTYVKEVDEWHTQRVDRLRQGDGWLSLAGLFWLEQGATTFGSDSGNTIIFPPETPGKIGTFFLEDSVIRVDITDNVVVTHGNDTINTTTLKADITGEPTILRWQSYSWYVIKREGTYGIRLKNSASNLIKSFTGIDRYPVDPRWRIEATLVPHDTLQYIAVPNVLDYITREPSPGKLVFEIDGEKYSIDPVADPDDERWFLIFGDATNGDETYGAGRYLYVDKPGADGKTIIDFNKAYNPPCIFTPYATCSLPPPQNVLSVPVTAGEKIYEGGAH